MTLLSSDDYPAIRAALDVSLDASALPDAVIALPIYQGAGEAAVLARDPHAASRTGVDLQHVTNAAVYYTAALLVPALPRLAKEVFARDYQYERTLVDNEMLMATLRGLAAAELDAVLTPGVADADRPVMFSLARGRRGA